MTCGFQIGCSHGCRIPSSAERIACLEIDVPGHIFVAIFIEGKSVERNVGIGFHGFREAVDLHLTPHAALAAGLTGHDTSGKSFYRVTTFNFHDNGGFVRCGGFAQSGNIFQGGRIVESFRRFFKCIYLEEVRMQQAIRKPDVFCISS